MNIRTIAGKAVHELRGTNFAHCGMGILGWDEITEDAVTCKRCITAKARAERIAKALAEREKKDDGEANP